MFEFIRATPKKRSVRIKKSSGVIFHNLYGKKKFLFNLGTTVLLFSIIFFVYLYQPLFFSWINYKQINNQPINQNLAIPTLKVTLIPTTIIQRPEIIETERNNDFKIDIPKIGAKADIVANVSPINKHDYLKILDNNNIAHSNYSSLPGMGKGFMTYLFAHSTQQSFQAVRKNSVFYLLGELAENDKILINYQGKNIYYQVYMKKIISAKETEYLTYTDPDKELLLLQTCWPIGTNWKRLLIFAERI